MSDVYPDLQITRDGHLAIVTLDRPDARNAYSQAMIDSLCALLDALELDRTVRCLVLTGAGNAFSAGGDLKLMKARAGMFAGDAIEVRNRYVNGIQRIPRRVERFTKPIVAAVNGAAIGAGLDLACMCDVRVASERARFGSTFVKVGLIPGDGGAYLLGRTIGFPRAIELILTGRVIESTEAERIGLVNRVVPADQVLSSAIETAHAIAANPPAAVQMARAACHQAWHGSLDDALRIAASYQGIMHQTADHLEGVDALLERREPEFKGA